MVRLARLCLILCSLWLAAGCSAEPDKNASGGPRPDPSVQIKEATLTINGGPTGGTFNYFANKMATVITRGEPKLTILSKSSGGSIDNLLALSDGRADMALAYAGDAFLARNGRLLDDHKRLKNFRGLAFLYGAPVQLVVTRASNVQTVEDLAGKTIAIGNPGSGAARSAKRYLKHLGLWDRINAQKTGYADAARDLIRGKVDGFWIMGGYPNSAILTAATQVPVRLLDLHPKADESSFYQFYPFYSQATIPAGTYEGQDQDVQTFQDSALWCTTTELSPDLAYLCLRQVFSDNGLADLQRTHRAAREMSLATGITNMPIPLHQGAVRFWSGQGVDIPPILLP